MTIRAMPSNVRHWPEPGCYHMRRSDSDLAIPGFGHAVGRTLVLKNWRFTCNFRVEDYGLERRWMRGVMTASMTEDLAG